MESEGRSDDSNGCAARYEANREPPSDILRWVKHWHEINPTVYDCTVDKGDEGDMRSHFRYSIVVSLVPKWGLVIDRISISKVCVYDSKRPEGIPTERSMSILSFAGLTWTHFLGSGDFIEFKTQQNARRCATCLLALRNRGGVLRELDKRVVVLLARHVYETGKEFY